ncbi:MAG: ribosomal protein S18-alanine N-acetyltransferase [Pseudomonadota bacterium]
MSAVSLDYDLMRMQAADLSTVMKNERLAYAYPWTEGIFADCLKSGHECWLFVLEGRNIGHSVLSVGAGESHLLNVCINPDHQGQGYGRILVEHMLARARYRHASCVFLEVRPSNTPACQLYQNLGFNEVGVRRDYYPADGGREDALVFAKEFL